MIEHILIIFSWIINTTKNRDFIFFVYTVSFNAELPATKLEVNGIQHKINATNLSSMCIPLSAGINDRHHGAYILIWG